LTAARQAIEAVYRHERDRVLATLIRLLGDFDRAEEALQDALAKALEAWPRAGVPDNPRAWLITVGRNRALDRLRRERLHTSKVGALAQSAADPAASPPWPEGAFASEDAGLEDDRLRLVFTCCHPALRPEAQVALTLHTVCGLSTEEIARAFLVPVPTLAQRLVRAKNKIRQAGIPYRVPPPELLPERLESVLSVLYLVFGEGYAATSGEALLRADLCREAIRVLRLVIALGEGRPDWREANALLALMLLHDSRREARFHADGSLVLLHEQDRMRWDRQQIAEGLERVESALRTGPAGPYALQAAIAALHARALRAEETDWRQIAALYDLLLRVLPSPVAELNRAVAVAMVDGPARGLLLLDALEARGELVGYHLLPAARADLLRRLGRAPEAEAAYRTALSLARTEPERRFLERRLAALA
jgi:RNA polymerase sigma-70 factor (ECF subfamily)